MPRQSQAYVSTIIVIHRTAKDAAVDGCWPKPGRRSKDRNVELEVEEVEIVAVTNLIKSQASKLTLVRGKSVWD